MKNNTPSSLIILVLGMLIFSACKKTEIIPVMPNSAPIANAGKDTTIIIPVNYILLDGIASNDQDNNITGCRWKLISGPSSSINIENPDAIKTMVKRLVTGIYLFELTVADNAGPSAKDTVQVTVKSPNPFTYTNNEIILKDQIWNYNWGMEINIDISAYVPANIKFKNVFIKRDYSPEWELVVSTATSSYGNNLYLYSFSDNDLLTISPGYNSSSNSIDDTPDIKIEY